MKRAIKVRLTAALLTVLLILPTGCHTAAPGGSDEGQPPAAAAVRAVWVPYLEIDEMLGGGAAAARTAIADCLERCRTRGVNTVYWHVRANSDAYYASALFEPAAVVRPLLQEGFDPLQAAVEEAHARGIALHAWVNPYRIGTAESNAKCADRFACEGRFYYTPSSDEVRRLVVGGVRELIAAYAVDGVQFDDYFYPPGAVAEDSPAPFEQSAYAAYTGSGGTLRIDDWRRAHVSRLIAAVYAVCHAQGRVFGVSPAHDLETDRRTLYADAAAWAQGGYVDYLCPQLYVGFQNENAPFDAVLAQWDALPRASSVELIAGLALYKTGLAEDAYAGTGRGEWAAGGDILARQAQAARARGWSGTALYCNRSFEPTAAEARDAETVRRESEALLAAW